MTSLYDVKDLASRVSREEQAAAQAKCEKARQAHLGLARQYQHKLSLMDAVETSIRISFG